jgi:hypothetical protein
MTSPRFITAVLLLCALSLASCADVGDELEDDDEAAPAEVTLVDRREAALSAASLISYVNGTYSGCKNRAGNWSLAVNGTPTMDYAPLSVVKGNSACQLAITAIKTTADGLLSASSPITLSTTYSTARSFGLPIKYQVNAALSSSSFTSNFTLTLVFSADVTPILAGFGNTLYEVVSSTTGTASAVLAPTGTLAASGVSLLKSLLGVVTSVTGSYVITQGTNLADNYVVVLGSVGDTYAEIDAAYQAGGKVALPQSIGGTLSIAANTLISLTDNLTGGLVRTIIIAKVTSGVTSYKKFTITFS